MPLGVHVGHDKDSESPSSFGQSALPKSVNYGFFGPVETHRVGSIN
jgi:hypothetical protein